MPRRPNALPKLDVALAHGGCLFVDYALEIPGLVYYADMSARADGRLPISSFFPSGHGHGGGTFKWYGATAKQRPRRLEANPFPAYRRRNGDTLRSLARRLAAVELCATFGDADHFLARNVKHISVYPSNFHDTAPLISNTTAETLGGIEEGVSECREAQVELMRKYEVERSTGRPQFKMRFEIRFVGEGLHTALAEDPPESGRPAVGPQSPASAWAREAAVVFMQQLTALFYTYHVEMWALRIVAAPEVVSLPAVLGPPSMELAVLEATVGLAKFHFNLTHTASLWHLGLDTLLRLLRLLCIARAMLFCCSPVEAALIEATDHLSALCNGTCDLRPSEGALKSERKEAKRVTAAASSGEADEAAGEEEEEEEEEAEAGESSGGGGLGDDDEQGGDGDGDEQGRGGDKHEGGSAGPSATTTVAAAAAAAPPAPVPANSALPKPRSLIELWLAVARSFRTVVELRGLMVAMRLRITAPEGRRLRRAELQCEFATAMSRRNDAMARAMALNICPELELAELEEAEAAAAQ